MPRRAVSSSRPALVGLVVACLLVAAAIIIPAATGWRVWANHFPPLHANWDPHLGPGTIPAIVLAVLAARFAIDLAASMSWRRMLGTAFVAGALWLAALALVDGLSGLGAILNSPHEYLRTAQGITDVPSFLSGFVARIAVDAPNNWPTHVAGHPPGATLLFWALGRVGLGIWQATGPLIILVCASIPVAVLVTMRRLGAERAGRAAAPFLVFGPAAIWMAVSADGLFAGVAAWGLCSLACAATARRWWATAAWGVGAGLLLGYCVMLSYGLPLLGFLAVAILLIARNARPLPWAIGAAIAVVLAFAAAGFSWWQGYPVLVERYWAGIATRRPLGYWIWGNFAALAISAGPLVGSSVGVALGRVRGLRQWTSEHRVVVLLTLAAAASVLAADLSQMSKAEVERIWLPFVPWLLVGTALLPERWRRYGFVGQLAFALVVQHLLFTGW